MTIDPTNLPIGTTLIVSDTDSAYDGTHGSVKQVYDDRVLLELQVDFYGGTLAKGFDLDQLSYPSG